MAAPGDPSQGAANLLPPELDQAALHQVGGRDGRMHVHAAVGIGRGWVARLGDAGEGGGG